MKLKVLSGILIYLLVVVAAVVIIQEPLISIYESKDEARIDTAFEQAEGSLDAVFLGPSTTYASWNAPYAFENYGITVYSMASAAQPIFASKFMIDDMRRKHPDAVYIINITHYLIKYETYLPNFIETYPLSLNKYPMTAYLASLGDLSAEKTVKAFFPILKYKDRWSEITLADFSPKKDLYKSASYYGSFLNKAKNVGNIQQDFETRESLEERDYKGLVDLMDYCEDEKVKVLFVIMPQGESVENRAGKQNETISILTERGFDVLDFRMYVDALELDPKKDFYNAQHMNINGAEKITSFLSEYLIAEYGFTDKRGDSNYSDWQEAVEAYDEVLKTSKLKNKK